MIDMSLGSLLNLYQFSTGRRLFAMQQVLTRAHQRSLPPLEAHIELCLEHDHQTRQLDARWSGKTGKQIHVTGEVLVQEVDSLVDRTLTALRNVAQAQADTATPGDGIAERVGTFLREIFPAGVAAITSLPYVDELAAVDRIVGRLQGDLQPLVDILHLERQATRLAQLAVDYRAALEAPKSTTSFGDVRSARARGQELMLEVVAMILGLYPRASGADLDARADLLGPIFQQNEAIRLYLRARRRVEDVDPETGDVDPEAPPSGPVESLVRDDDAPSALAPSSASSSAPASAPASSSAPAPR